MNINTLKLLLPIIAVTIQNNSSTTLIPPFLQSLHMPVAAIGILISLNPIFALLSRLPVGIAYRPGRARLLISAAVLVMGITNFLYGVVSDGVSFAIVHSLNGFAYGAVTTLYMAFYVDSLDPQQNRNHAMGYYVGTLAVGYSTGNFFGGLVADHLGFRLTFQVASLLSLLPCFLLWLFRGERARSEAEGKEKRRTKLSSRSAWKAMLEPELAIVVITALFVNVIHQIGGVFISLYGVAVGMNLTQIGTIRAAFAGCNAITRTISGHVVNKFGHRRLSHAGIPLQCAILMLVPLFTGFGAVMTVYMFSGFMRAVVIVSNAVGLVQDVDETKVPRGLGSAIYNAAGDVGNILGPAAGGLIAHATSIGGVFVVGPLATTALFLLGVFAARRLGRAPRTVLQDPVAQ